MNDATHKAVLEALGVVVTCRTFDDIPETATSHTYCNTVYASRYNAGYPSRTVDSAIWRSLNA